MIRAASNVPPPTAPPITKADRCASRSHVDSQGSEKSSSDHAGKEWNRLPKSNVAQAPRNRGTTTAPDTNPSQAEGERQWGCLSTVRQ
jgi:hypothetical protein